MLERDVPAIQNMAGWSDATLLGLFFNFIEENKLETKLKQFLADKVKEDEELSAFLDNPAAEVDVWEWPEFEVNEDDASE